MTMKRSPFLGDAGKGSPASSFMGPLPPPAMRRRWVCLEVVLSLTSITSGLGSPEVYDPPDSRFRLEGGWTSRNSGLAHHVSQATCRSGVSYPCALATSTRHSPAARVRTGTTAKARLNRGLGDALSGPTILVQPPTPRLDLPPVQGRIEQHHSRIHCHQGPVADSDGWSCRRRPYDQVVMGVDVVTAAGSPRLVFLLSALEHGLHAVTVVSSRLCDTGKNCQKTACGDDPNPLSSSRQRTDSYQAHQCRQNDE